MGSEREPIRDPDQPGIVQLDIVHLRDLRRGVPEQVRDLFRRDAEERSVRLFHKAASTHRCKGGADRSLLLLRKV